MLYIFLYSVFVAINVLMIVWGVLKKDRFFQYPTVAGVTWLSFFAVPVYVSLVHPEKYSNEVLGDGGLYIALIMLCLCSAAGFWGYMKGLQWNNTHNPVELSYRRLFNIGCVLYTIGFISAYKLAQLSGGFINQFTGGGHYGIEWSGDTIKYNFLVKLIYIGLTCALISALKEPTFLKLIVTSSMAIYPLCVVIFLGRRATAASLMFILLLSMMFVRKRCIPRLLFIIIVFFTPLAIYYGPAYRSASQHGLKYGAIKDSIQESKTIDSILSGAYNEFDIFVHYGAVVQNNLLFQYGVSFYNTLVYYYVPRQVVGEEVKASLFLPSAESPADISFDKYGFRAQHGWFATGIYEAFSQFWFLGCLIYYAIGLIYGRLWVKAYINESVSAQLWYILSAYFMAKTIVSSVSGAFAECIYIFICMKIISYYCRSRSETAQDYGAYIQYQMMNMY